MTQPEKMRVGEIIAGHLHKIGADGLCREDCGCSLADSAWSPRDGIQPDCVPTQKPFGSIEEKCEVCRET